MANANLFQSYLQPARSALDYENDYAKADALRNSNALQALSLQQAAAVNGQKNALRQAVSSGLDLTSDAGQAQALTVAPDVAPGLIKTVQDSITSRAAAQKDLGAANASNATAGKTKQDTQIAAHQQHLQSLSTVNTPEDAVQWMVQGVQSGALPSQGLAPARIADSGRVRQVEAADGPSRHDRAAADGDDCAQAHRGSPWQCRQDH
jgi:hypothetical protein